MKNPMTPDEMKQAIDDNDAGHDMQLRSNHDSESQWKDRIYGKPLNFYDYQYRRKPELIERFISIDKDGDEATFSTLSEALSFDGAYRQIVRLMPDPDWTPPDQEESNPWRKIAKGEWPKCKPGKNIVLRYGDSFTVVVRPDKVPWSTAKAIEWKYEEDE